MADRGSNGRFLPGNPGNPHARGRPRRAAEQDYLAATVAGVPLGDWQAIVRKAVAQARRGDHRARDWLGKALIGSDPIPLAQLVEELRAELERLKHGLREDHGEEALGGGAGRPPFRPAGRP